MKGDDRTTWIDDVYSCARFSLLYPLLSRSKMRSPNGARRRIAPARTEATNITFATLAHLPPFARAIRIIAYINMAPVLSHAPRSNEKISGTIDKKSKAKRRPRLSGDLRSPSAPIAKGRDTT